MGEAPAMGRESGDAGDEPVGLVAGGLVAHLVLRVAGGDDPLVAELGLERERAGGDADALLVAVEAVRFEEVAPEGVVDGVEVVLVGELGAGDLLGGVGVRDRKSTRLNSSHVKISYAVFCLKKKKVT